MRLAFPFCPLALLVVSVYAGYGVFDECFDILDAKDSDGGCRDHKADLTTAWKEACDAVTAADNAIKLMRSPPDEQTEKEEHAKWAKEQLRINPMTAAMFGSTFDDKGTFAPFSRLNNILVNVEALMNACNGQGGKWSLYCTDSDWKWLKETDEDPEQPGKKISETQSPKCEDGGLWYSKKRIGTESHYWVDAPPKKVLGVFSKGGPICKDKDTLAVTHVAVKMLTWCKPGLDQLVDTKAHEIYADRKKPFSSQSKSSDLDKTGGMALTFIHEMLHMVALLDDEKAYDSNGNLKTKKVARWDPVSKKYEEETVHMLAFQYANCVNLAKHKPNRATLNPDSVAYFAIAMYLKNWDWSFGYAQTLK